MTFLEFANIMHDIGNSHIFAAFLLLLFMLSFFLVIIDD
jgi:hypothetical protein